MIVREIAPVFKVTGAGVQYHTIALEIRLVRDYADMSRRAAKHVLEALRRRPDLLLGAVTGDSPREMYRRLARAWATSPRRFARLRVIAMDEWTGLPRGHEATCEAFVRKEIVGPLRVTRSRWQSWRSDAPDRETEARRVSRWLRREGPLDLCLLGLGRNGHLLMNEPGPAFEPAPHASRLLPSTRRHSMVRSLRPRPRFGYTLGLADILQSREIVLLVSGRHKRAPLRRMLAGRVTTACPASFLWLHPRVTVYCDREAAGASRR
jgi:galactosamine-6-phosphate isomerase